MVNFRKYAAGFLIALILAGCEKENDEESFIVSDYAGSYKNVEFTETLIGNYTPGIYREGDIPEELKNMTHGRLEIDFIYMGGALASFMPILYYGSINKDENDNAVEETQYHLVVEIGHYNVIPFPVENLFYTICYERYPLYCRDTYFPVISGEHYTFVLDKRPEGIILQLMKGEEIVNSMPSAFFPDSAQLFFSDVTRWIEKNRGDSLETILTVGQGFVGFDKGLRTFNGQVPAIRIYKYDLQEQDAGYELVGVKNQHFVRQLVHYSVRDNITGEGNVIRLKFNYHPYVYEDGIMQPTGNLQSSEIPDIRNDQQLSYPITRDNIGLYEVFLETIGSNDQVIRSTPNAYKIWVYPESWEFNY